MWLAWGVGIHQASAMLRCTDQFAQANSQALARCRNASRRPRAVDGLCQLCITAHRLVAAPLPLQWPIERRPAESAPAPVRPHIPFDTSTSSRADYKEVRRLAVGQSTTSAGARRRRLRLRVARFRHRVPVLLVSVLQWPMERPTTAPAPAPQRPHIPFDASTTTRDAYKQVRCSVCPALLHGKCKRSELPTAVPVSVAPTAAHVRSNSLLAFAVADFGWG
jgi:hypothetical protein